MKPRELFERVRSLWPDAVVLKDHSNQDGDNALWSLVHTYEAIERDIEDDDWLALAAWAFHQALTELAMLKLSAGEQVVMPASVTLASFDRDMRANLDDDSWTIERQNYGQMTD